MSDVGTRETAYVALEFVLNSKVPSGTLTVPDAIIAAAKVKVGSPEQLIAIGIKRRPDVLVDEHKLRAAELFAEEPPYRFIPVLGLIGTFRAAPEAGAITRWDDETLALTLTWTIYDAGVRFADKKSRDAQTEQADLALKMLKRQVESDVRTAMSGLEAAQKAFLAAEDEQRFSKQSEEETRILYRAGLAKMIEVTTAASSTFAADVDRLTALYAMAQAYMDLRQAMGLDPNGTELR